MSPRGAENIGIARSLLLYVQSNEVERYYRGRLVGGSVQRDGINPLAQTVEAQTTHAITTLAGNYEHEPIGKSLLVRADCREWLAALPENSLHAVVTDPPYGVKEYEDDQIEKRTNGKGGIWRIPPSFDGSTRSPVPRFTALLPADREAVRAFFTDWTQTLLPALRPGAHIFVASNTFLSQLVFSAIVEGGLEFRGEIIRLVQTLRGGDRPKNAEAEFPDVVSMPRGSYEPWGVFRKPIPAKMKVSDCLREYGTGGLRRLPDGRPFTDVIESERTSKAERAIVNHPSLKPQSILRPLVYASLPLGEGVIADPFAGSGSTVAASEAMGLQAVGVERSLEYYEGAKDAIPQLQRIRVPGWPIGDQTLKLPGMR